MNKKSQWLSLISLALFITGCGPQFLRNAHKYDPPDKPRLVKYWSCESQEDYFWGDCNWSYGYYLMINGKPRLVGASWCVGSELDAGYALNAIYEDRDRHGALELEQLGSQPKMHCRMLTSFLASSDQKPLGRHDRMGRVKGLTFVNKDSDVSLSLINRGDNTTEVRGHEISHQHWKGEWETRNWREENFINTIGLQPTSLAPMPRQKWINPDPPPIRDYNDDWHINRGQPKGIPYDELIQLYPELIGVLYEEPLKTSKALGVISNGYRKRT